MLHVSPGIPKVACRLGVQNRRAPSGRTARSVDVASAVWRLGCPERGGTAGIGAAPPGVDKELLLASASERVCKFWWFVGLAD